MGSELEGLVGPHRGWIEAHLGPLHAASDASWQHAASDVVRVEGERGAAYLKRYRERRKFEQEVHAYRTWCPALERTTRLVDAVVEPSRALLVEAAAGEPLLTATGLETEEERNAWRRAGDFLRALHRLPHQDDDPVPLPAALAARAASWIGRAGDALTESEGRQVLELAEAPWPDTLSPPKRVPCHRDFTPRNWLVAPGQLTVIDFEHARADLWLVDVERALGEVPPGRDDLRTAFWTGYGPEHAEEAAALGPRVAAVLALTQISWAVENRDARFEARGRAGLAQAIRRALR